MPTMTYPDIYYKLHPHILTACDELEKLGAEPTEENVVKMTTRVCENAYKQYPELRQYVRRYNTRYPVAKYRNSGAYGIEFFGGGLFFDLAAILLLGEFFGRRRFRRGRRRF